MPKPHIELIARGVWIHEDHVLLCRNRHAGHVFLPGGHVEFGEPASVSLMREAREELGIQVQVLELLGVIEASFVQGKPGRPRRSDKTHHELNLVFRMHPAPLKASPRSASGSRRRTKGSPNQLPELTSKEEHIAFIWAPLDQVVGPKATIRLLPRAILPILGHLSKGRAIPIATSNSPDSKGRAVPTHIIWASQWE